MSAPGTASILIVIRRKNSKSISPRVSGMIMRTPQKGVPRGFFRKSHCLAALAWWRHKPPQFAMPDNRAERRLELIRHFSRGFRGGDFSSPADSSNLIQKIKVGTHSDAREAKFVPTLAPAHLKIQKFPARQRTLTLTPPPHPFHNPPPFSRLGPN